MRINLPDPSRLFLFAGLLTTTWAAQASEVYPDAVSTRALEVGAKLPSVQITAIDGKQVELAELTRESGALLVFYRGGW